MFKLKIILWLLAADNLYYLAYNCLKSLMSGETEGCHLTLPPGKVQSDKENYCFTSAILSSAHTAEMQRSLN